MVTCLLTTVEKLATIFAKVCDTNCSLEKMAFCRGERLHVHSYTLYIKTHYGPSQANKFYLNSHFFLLVLKYPCITVIIFSTFSSLPIFENYHKIPSFLFFIQLILSLGWIPTAYIYFKTHLPLNYSASVVPGSGPAHADTHSISSQGLSTITKKISP